MLLFFCNLLVRAAAAHEKENKCRQTFYFFACCACSCGVTSLKQTEHYLLIKEVFSEKSCFKNFAHPLSEGENIKK